MRALCGALITGGSLIGLGLTALGFGMRFQHFGPEVVYAADHQHYGVPTLVLILVVLLISLLIGFAIAFMGLAFHHERRQHERHGGLGTTSSTNVTP
jgi:hypothetical protein